MIQKSLNHRNIQAVKSLVNREAEINWCRKNEVIPLPKFTPPKKEKISLYKLLLVFRP